MDAPPAAGPDPGRTILGHPRGLLVLSGTEGFVGFGYYGMMSLLVLFLSDRILRPGRAGHVLGLVRLGRLLGWSDPAAVEAHAAALTGLFGALAYAMPLLGGLLADRLLGRTRSVVAGLALLTLGLALLAVEPLFLLGLLCVLCGAGLGGTLKAQLGALYPGDDPRRADGFQIYAFSVQVAVLVAPVVCGVLGEDYAWRWGFGAASAGTGLGLLFYLCGRRTLPPEPPPAGRPGARTDAARPRLARRDRLVLLALLLLLPVLALAAVGNMQVYDAYLLWGRDHYDLRWNGHRMPVSWLLSVDSFISMGGTVLSVGFWTWLERRGHPVAELPKIAVGAVLCALAVLVLAAAPAGRVGLGWGLAFHVLDDVGFTNTYAVSLALYSRLAPPALGSTVVNACVLQIFLANLIVSRLAGLLGTISPSRFWLLHALLVGSAAAVLVLVALAGRAVRERSRRRTFVFP